jgi:arginine/lysine/ornithine decarboxylase
MRRCGKELICIPERLSAMSGKRNSPPQGGAQAAKRRIPRGAADFMKLKTPILDCIKKYKNSDPARFHTPGHQGIFGDKNFFDAGFDANADEGLFSSCGFDITELSFSDNLLRPSGVIKESENQAADFYGSEGTLFFTNGATSAVFAAVAAAASLKDDRYAPTFAAAAPQECGGSDFHGYPGTRAAFASASNGKILIGKNCHKSVFSAAAICGLTPVFYDSEDDGRGGFLPAKRANIERALTENSHKKRGIDPPFYTRKYERAEAAADGVGVVVVTSPDYFGRCAAVGEIRESLRARGILLIVDGSHGAHFPFGSNLPEHPAKIADFVVDGCHKTMPVYTGGALLHCGSGELRLRAEFFRSVFHSTSPQYLTLASIDLAIAKMAEEGERAYSDLYLRVGKLKAAAARAGYSVFGEKDGAEGDNRIKKKRGKAVEKRGIERDFSRLVIDCFPHSGATLRKALEKRNIFAEMSAEYLVVFILSPYNLSANDRLENALTEISAEKVNTPEIKNAGKTAEAPDIQNAEKPKAGAKNAGKKPKTAEKKTESFLSYFEGIDFLDLADCLSRTSATELGAYPPGIPTVFKGDTITGEKLEYLLKNKDRLFGLTEGKIAVFANENNLDGASKR